MPANLVLGDFFWLQTADFSLCPCLVERGLSIPLPLLRAVIRSRGLHLHGWPSCKAPPPNTITQGRVHQYLIHNSPLSAFRFSFSTHFLSGLGATIPNLASSCRWDLWIASLEVPAWWMLDLYCTLHHVRVETSHLEQKPQEISKKLLIMSLENLSPLPTYPLPSHSFRPSSLLITSNFSHFLHEFLLVFWEFSFPKVERPHRLWWAWVVQWVAVLGEIIVWQGRGWDGITPLSTHPQQKGDSRANSTWEKGEISSYLLPGFFLRASVIPTHPEPEEFSEWRVKCPSLVGRMKEVIKPGREAPSHSKSLCSPGETPLRSPRVCVCVCVCVHTRACTCAEVLFFWHPLNFLHQRNTCTLV